MWTFRIGIISLLVLCLIFSFIYCDGFYDDQFGQKMYVGCTKILKLDTSDLVEHHVSDYMTIEFCTLMCKNETGSKFAALSNGNQCICPNAIGDEVNEDLCNLVCSGNSSQICGGQEDYFSVYSTGQYPGVPADLQVLNVTNTSIQIMWKPPNFMKEPATWYEVTTILNQTFAHSKLSQPLYRKYSGEIRRANIVSLLPASQYNISVSAVTSTGVGQVKSLFAWTLIDDPVEPSLPTLLKKESTKMEVGLEAVDNPNGPISSYRIIVIDEGMNTGFDSNAFKSYQESQKAGLSYYIAAEFQPEELPDKFVVGDNRTYGGYYNPPLPAETDIHVLLGIVSCFNNITKYSYSRSTHGQHGVIVLDVGTDGQSTKSSLVVGLSVAIGICGFLLLLSVIMYFILKRRFGLRRRILDNQELSLQGPMIEVESNSYSHNGYIPEEEDEHPNHYEILKQMVWNIPRNFLELRTDVLGKGKYGSVMKGTVQQRGFPRPSAIHTIADGELTQEDKTCMLRDLDLLIKTSSHSNIVELVGTCETPDTLFVVLEYHPATLKDVLLESRCLQYGEANQNRICSLLEIQMLEAAVGVARAMEYLAQKKIVHKQLAARNVLMVDGVVPKITGFGIAQYSKGNDVPDYIRWTAQEIFRSRHFVVKCDVWSYGILLWEITSIGGTPYAAVHTSEVATRVMRGLRPHQLTSVGDDLYQLMLQCWQLDLDERPTFSEIIHILENMFNDCTNHLNFTSYSSFSYEPYCPELERK